MAETLAEEVDMEEVPFCICSYFYFVIVVLYSRDSSTFFFFPPNITLVNKKFKVHTHIFSKYN